MKKIEIEFNEPLPKGTFLYNLLYKNRLGDLYLDEKTMLVYVPVATAEHVECYFGEIKEEEENATDGNY